MSTEKVTITAAVINGKLDVSDSQKQYLAETIRRWKTGSASVTVKRERAGKSQLQLGYYHALVLPMIVEEQCGDPDDQEQTRQTHLELKARFLPPQRFEFVDKDTGEVFQRDMVPSLADLNTKEMADFTEKVVLWAAEFLGLVVPPPDPAWKQKREAVHAQ